MLGKDLPCSLQFAGVHLTEKIYSIFANSLSQIRKSANFSPPQALPGDCSLHCLHVSSSPHLTHKLMTTLTPPLWRYVTVKYGNIWPSLCKYDFTQQHCWRRHGHWRQTWKPLQRNGLQQVQHLEEIYCRWWCNIKWRQRYAYQQENAT